MPHEQAIDVPSYAKGSALTINEIKRSLEQCPYEKLDFVGGKIAIRPNEASVDERVSYITSLLALLDNVTAK
jgi:hypothetical protein